MKIVIAPQAFKGTFTAQEVARAMQNGIRRALPQAETVLMPIADGGDGTREVLGGCVQDAAVIEMAQVCGYKKQGDPLRASTYELGQLILGYLDQGFRSFIIGLGGSATNDAGAGMLQALGVRLVDRQGNELKRGGESLRLLERIDPTGMDPRIQDSTFLVACDVTNPLLGPQGATRTYAPQKGATKEMMESLEEAIARFALVAGIEDQPYYGAAGGTAAALAFFLNAKLVSGAEFVLDALHFDRALEDADVLVIGEGRLDSQTLFNKGPGVAMSRAKNKGIPVYAIVGGLGKDYKKVEGIEQLVAFDHEASLAEIEEATYKLFSRKKGPKGRQGPKGPKGPKGPLRESTSLET